MATSGATPHGCGSARGSRASADYALLLESVRAAAAAGEARPRPSLASASFFAARHSDVLFGAILSSNADGFFALHVSDVAAPCTRRRCTLLVRRASRERKAAGGADRLLALRAQGPELVRVLADAVHTAGGGGGGSGGTAGGGWRRLSQAHHYSQLYLL